MIFIFLVQFILLVISSSSEAYYRVPGTVACEQNRSLTAYTCEGTELTISCHQNESLHIVYANFGRRTDEICKVKGKAESHVNWLCSSSQSLSIVRERCSGNSECNVFSSDTVFGDPCPSSPKYLAVMHHCYPVCSAHCAVGCNMTGAGMCDRCDLGFGLTKSGTCDVCSAHCFTGCNTAGARKCDQCDQGFEFNIFGSCERTIDYEQNSLLTAYACEGTELMISCHQNDSIYIVYANFGRRTDKICKVKGKAESDVNWNCSSSQSLSIVRELCSGKSECNVSAINDVFGDPCSGSPKYLAVVHHCNPVCSAHCAVGCNTTGAGMCDQCDFGFGLMENGTCDVCSSNCFTGCNAAEAGKCDQCDRGFGFTIFGSCEPCSQYCSAGCNRTGAGKCNQCDPGYELTADESCGNMTKKFCNFNEDKRHSIQWNATSFNTEVFRPCPGNATGGPCSRNCSLDIKTGKAVWSKTNCNGCFSKEFVDLLAKFEEAELGNQTLLADIANRLSVLTSKSEGLSSGNLNASLMMLDRLAVLRNNMTDIPSDREITSFVQAASNVLQPINYDEWKDLESVNRSVGTIILFSADVYGRSLSSTLKKTNYSYEDADNLVLEAWSLERTNLPTQLQFPSRAFRNDTGDDEILVSMTTLEDSISSESQPTLNVWGSYYRTVHEFLPQKKNTDDLDGNTEVVNSRILSFSIGGRKAEEKLNHPVRITLRHNQTRRLSFQRKCAFWNFHRSDWDSNGCSMTWTNLTHTICSCDHLTNFAIMMSVNPQYDKALSMISTIGCSISVVTLILTVVVYVLTWKQSKSAQATVLLNLCIALIIANTIFMAGADKVDSEVGCKTVAVLLHYFFLVAFFIMLAEGVELLLYIIFVFHVRRTIETTLLLVSAWIISLVIVAVSLGSTNVEGYGNGSACWLSVDKGLIWAFIGPVLCIITTNFVILTIALVWMSRKRTFLSNNEKKRNEIRATLWNLSVTCPVLGLGWLFGVFSIVFRSVVFQYLFVIVNSLQGLFIFVFHVLFHNKKMNDKLSYVYSNVCRCRKSEHSVSTQMTSAGEQKKQKLDVPLYSRISEPDNSNSSGTQLINTDSSAMEQECLDM